MAAPYIDNVRKSDYQFSSSKKNAFLICMKKESSHKTVGWLLGIEYPVGNWVPPTLGYGLGTLYCTQTRVWVKSLATLTTLGYLLGWLRIDVSFLLYMGVTIA